MAAVTTAVKKPDHVFVVPAAREAAQAADRVVNDWTASAFEGKIAAIKDAGQDYQKLDLDKLVAFYKQAPAAIAQLNEAILKCHENSGILAWIPLLNQPNDVLTSKRAPQFELLKLTKTAEERTKAAKADAEALRAKIRSVEDTQQTLAAKVTDLAKGLGTACGNYVHSKGGYSSVGIGTTYGLYSNDSAIQHYEETRAKEKQSAAPAKPEASKASANDAKAPEKSAAAAKSSEPNWNHPFLIDITSADRAAIDTEHAKLSIEAQAKRAAKLPALEAAEKAKGLQGKEAIVSDVALWITWEQENRRANNVIDNMRRAVEACDQACMPLSAVRAGVLKDLGLETAFEESTARVKADKEELLKRIAKLSESQKTVDPAMTEFTNAVGRKCFDFLYANGKVWYYLSSYAGAIEQFKQEYMTEQKKAEPKTVVVMPVIAKVSSPILAATQPIEVVVQDKKVPEPVKTEASQTTAAAKTAQPKPASKPKLLHFDPAVESPILKGHLRKLEPQHQKLNFALLEGTAVTPSQQTEYAKLANEVGTYLLDHHPELLPSPLKVSQTYSDHWRQANSMIEGLNAMLATLQNTDSKHTKK